MEIELKLSNNTIANGKVPYKICTPPMVGLN